MEALGHLIFELFKIGLLSFAYAWIIRFILQKLRKGKPVVQLKKLATGIVMLLFAFMCTPYGDHGLGDSASIPVGWSNGLSNVDWDDIATLDDIYMPDKSQVQTTSFFVKDGFISGNLVGNATDSGLKYFVYDTDSKIFKGFKTEDDYAYYAKAHILPLASEFKTFEKNYHDYWSGWRFFLLP